MKFHHRQNKCALGCVTQVKTIQLHIQYEICPLTLFNTNLLHEGLICQLLLQHVSALTVGHLQGAHLSFDLFIFCVNLCGRNSTYMTEKYDIKAVL